MTLDLVGQSLSPREREVAALVAAGWGNKHIARMLFIDESTVKTHLHRCFVKAGVENRTQLALWFERSEPPSIEPAPPAPGIPPEYPDPREWGREAARALVAELVQLLSVPS